jgi:hypothetical protein
LNAFPGFGTAELTLPLVGGVYNSSGVLLGITLVATPLGAVNTFLRALALTPNAAAFMFESKLAVVGWSLPGDFHTVTVISASTAVSHPCFSTANSVARSTVTYSVCSVLPSQVPYAPLRAIAGDTSFLGGDVRGVKDFKGGRQGVLRRLA